MTDPDPWSGFGVTPTSSAADPWAGFNLQPPAAPPLDKYQQAAIEDQKALEASGAPLNQGYTRRLAKGATLNWLDEIQAGMRTPIEMFRHGGVNPVEAYRYAKAQEDLANQKTEENTRGFLGTGAELLGGLATAGSTIGGGTKAASTGANIWNNVKGGAIYGSIAGGGAAPTISDIPKDAIEGALGGAAVGAVLPVAAKTIGTVFSPLIQPFRRPDNVVEQYLTKKMADAGVTPAAIEASIAQARTAGQPFTVADAMGYEGQRALAAQAKQPGAQRQLITDAMTRGGINMANRVGSEVGTQFGAPVTAEAATQSLQNVASDLAAPVYRAAEQVPTYSPRIQQFIDDPIVRTGLRHGVELQRLEALAANRPFNPLDMVLDAEGNVVGVPNMRTLHTAKVGLDKMEQAARETGTGRATADSRAIAGVRRAMLDEIDRLNPTYAEARRIYAGPMATRDAVQEGRDMATTGRYADNIRRFNEMSPTEQWGARIGYADAVRTALEKTGIYPNILRGKSAKGTNEVQAFALPGRADPLRQFLDREEVMQATANAAKGGSSSFENFADVGGTPGGLNEALGLATSAAHGNPLGVASNAINLGQRVWGDAPREAQRLAITRALLAHSPDDVAALTARLADYDLRRRGVNPFVSRPPRIAPIGE